MLSHRYYQFINRHKFIAEKVGVYDLAFQLSTHQFSPYQLKHIALYVYRNTPKYAYIVCQKLVTDIFPAKSIITQPQKQIVQDTSYGLVSLFIAKQSTFQYHDFVVFKERAMVIFNQLISGFGVNAQNILLRAYFQFYNGELSQAMELARKLADLLHSQQELFIKWGCHILMAQIYYARRMYQKCIDQLKICFKMYNDLPIKARVAIGHCYFYMGQYQMAQMVFKRVLQLDSRCLQAVIGLAVICERNEQYQNYFNCLRAASKNHPLILLHLAEHFLIIKQLTKAREFAQRGIKSIKRMTRINQWKQTIRDDYYEYQARFNNIIGQCYHIQQKYVKALKWYNKISRKDTMCSIWNRYQSAQCYIALQFYKQANYEMEAMYQQYYDFFTKIYKQFKLLNDTYRLAAYVKVKLKLYQTESKKIQSYLLDSVKFDKSNPQIRYELSWLYSMQGQFRKALVQYKVGMELMASQGIEISAEMYNNMAVLYLQTDLLEQAKPMLHHAINTLQSQTEVEEAAKLAIKSIILYNYGIVAQHSKLIQTAIQLYQQSIQKSKLFLDGRLRLAYCYHQLQANQLAYQVLQQGIQVYKQVQEQTGECIDTDRIYTLKAYIQMQDGDIEGSRLSMEYISTHDTYNKLMRIGLLYKQLCRQPNQHQLIQLCVQLQQIMQQDKSNIFAIAGLLIVRLAMQQMGGEQLKQYQVYSAFGQIKTNINKKYIYFVQYNTALFSMRANNMESAIAILKQLRKTNPQQINSLAVYCYSTIKQVVAAYKLAKLNVLVSPGDVVVRQQLQVVILQKYKARLQNVRSKLKESEWVGMSQQLRQGCRLLKYIAFIDADLYCSKYPNINKTMIDKLKVQCKKMLEIAISYQIKCRQHINPPQQVAKRQPAYIIQDDSIKKRYKHNNDT